MIYHAFCGYYSIYGDKKHTTYVCPEVAMKLYNDKLSASQMKIFSKHFELAIEELLKTPEVVERRNKAMERANKTKGTKC